jgi:hypothetical protein
MSILTYDTAVSGEIAPKPAKGFWTRAFDRLLEARRQQAERMLRQHLALHDLNAADWRVTKRSEDSLPFIG